MVLNQAVNEIYNFSQLHLSPIVWNEWVDIIEAHHFLFITI